MRYDARDPDDFLSQHRAFSEHYGPQSGHASVDETSAGFASEPPTDDPRFSDAEQPSQPKQDGKAPLPLVYFDALQPMLDARDFVQGVLLENSAAVVYGESNSGKTFWTTDLSLHVAAGLEWNGRRVEQGGVVYCVLEGGQGFYNRVVAWRLANRATNIPFAAIPSQLNLLDPAADTGRLIAAIKHAAEAMSAPVKLVVIDTLSRALAGGNENAPDDMGALVMNMDRIRQESGAAVMFVHHSGKDQARGARGWSGLRAAIDTEIEVIAFEGDEKEARLVKQRDMKKGAVFQFSLHVTEVGRNRHDEPVTTCVVQHGQISTEKSKAAKPLTGHTKRAYEILCNALLEQGDIGIAGIPDGLRSVPEKLWRDAFYESSMPGAEYEAKKKAFGRATKELLARHAVGMAKNAVWIVRAEDLAI